MNRYISIKVVLDNVLDHPLLKDVSLERAVNHAVNFIRIVGCPNLYAEKTEVIKIKDYRGVLPCDLDEIIQVRKYSGDHETIRYSTDTFHMSNSKVGSSDLTYKVQGGIIFTSIKEGDIEISYRAIPIDKDGYPLIPDNSMFLRALELYIKKQCFTVLFDLGKITPQVYNNVLQEYAWAVGQAQSDLVRPSIDQMIAITNMWNKLIPGVTRDTNNGFKYEGTEEKINTH